MSILGDKRLDARLEKMKKAINQNMHVSLPRMMGMWSQLKAAYRFLK